MNMKTTKKPSFKRLIIFILLLVSNYSFSQEVQNMLKYWNYRNRLNNYFVVPGEKWGESQIICIRNMIYAGNDTGERSKSVDYGQHGQYQGLYISVLATEYYLLNKSGQYADANRTEQELLWALEAFKKYWDIRAEDLLILKKY